MSIQKILDFCNKYKKIYCYGAGKYGLYFGTLLEKYNIKYEGYIVSQGGYSTYQGKNVYELATIIDMLDGDVGVILALSEKNHREVKEKLEVISDEQICSLSDTFIETNIVHECSELLLKKRIYAEGCDTYSDVQVRTYDERYNRLKCHFSKIRITEINLHAIGLFCNWMRYVEQSASDCYTAYYPIVWADRFSIYNLPNQELARMCKLDNAEIICDDDINFWKYVIMMYSSEIEIKATDLFFEDSNKHSDYSYNVNQSNVIRQYVKTTSEFEREGYYFLNKHNINKYICIFARDSIYRSKVMHFCGTEINEQDVFRNSDIKCFEKAAKLYNERNYSLVRMGALASSNLSDKTLIFDYAGKYRTEKLDIFLAEHCKYFVGDDSGIQILPILFGKPTIALNFPGFIIKNDWLIRKNPEKDLRIFEKIWDPQKERFLTIKEMLEFEVDCVNRTETSVFILNEYFAKGYVPVKNTPEEILEVMNEMDQIIDGEVVYDEEDLELRQKYNNLLNQYSGYNKFQARLGRDFIKKNKWLLLEE